MNGNSFTGPQDIIIDADFIRSRWAKQQGAENQEFHYHPLVYHLLDVATCAKILLDRNPLLASGLRSAFGENADGDKSYRLAVCLAGLHDIGKFASPFQRKLPELYEELTRSNSPRDNLVDERHDVVGLGLWVGDKGIPALHKELFPEADFDATEAMLLGSPVFGHHGSPPDATKVSEGKLKLHFDHSGIVDARKFSVAFRDFIGAESVVPKDMASCRRASFLLAALTNVADWLGSSTTYFPYTAPDMSMSEYWAHTLEQADKAVVAAGLVSSPSSPNSGFAAMFPGFKPTDFQSIMDDIDVDEQFIVVAEEAAGGGKTEAALSLASRAIGSGLCRGLFFGLPTMTTADAQAARQAEIYRRLFGGDAHASMTVAHSSVRSGERLFGSDASDWLADDRRRRLLADVCVGTVDQVLLAAMPAKFASVRLFGLIGKLVVLDEVHSFDAYTTELICNFITMHAALGGSVVLLSATLESKTKERMLDAFASGAGIKRGDEGSHGGESYPLITTLQRDTQKGGVTVYASPEPAARAPGDKEVAFVRSVEEAEQAVLEAAQSGLCVAWIRNTVDQALESGRILANKHAGVDIFHGRFPSADLDAARRRVLDRFGKNSTANMRRGRIVVATSVIEQSLDIDFDLVVIDLKPVDSIIQALGRARRHSRDVEGNPLADGTPDQRPHRPMLVLSPDPKDVRDENWYRDLLGNASYIYQDSALLWRTVTVLEDARWVRYRNVRDLVENAYNGEYDVPDVLDASSVSSEGKEYGDRGQAKAVSYGFGPKTGYVRVASYWDDQRIPTRLGDSMEVVLVKRLPDGEIAPYNGTNWSSGLIRLRYHDGLAFPDGQEFDAVRKALSFCIPVVVTLTNSGLRSEGAFRDFTVLPEHGLVWGHENDLDEVE